MVKCFYSWSRWVNQFGVKAIYSWGGGVNQFLDEAIYSWGKWVNKVSFSKHTSGVLGQSHDTFTDVNKLVESFGLTYYDVINNSYVTWLVTANYNCGFGSDKKYLENFRIQKAHTP